MSHRIFLRFLPFAFVILFGVVTYIFYNQHKQTVLVESNKQIEMILKTNKALHSYVENIQKPVIYKLQEEGKLYKDFFNPKILSLTYIARNIHEQYAKTEQKAGNVPYSYKLATNNPRNPINKATPFEKEILDRFQKKEITDFDTFITENNEQYYYKAMPIDPNKESCMKCHSTPDVAPKELIALYGPIAAFGEKVGDIRAMISLKIPVSSIVNNSLQQFYINLFVVAFIFIVFYFILASLLKKDISLQQTLAKLEESNQELHEKNIQLQHKDELLAEQSKITALGEMLGNIAHQWRQPLSVISAAATGLQVQKECSTISDEKVDNACELINKNTQYLSEIINNFTNYIENKNVKQKFNLSTIIQNFLEIINTEASESKITIALDLQEDITLDSFPSELTQCFVNIFNNSKEAFQISNSDERYIFISTSWQNGTTKIIFKDTAGGISEDVLPKIFEPYFTTKHKSQGTGLGLHIVYKLITQTIGGTIIVHNVDFKQNEKEYRGAEVTIQI